MIKNSPIINLLDDIDPRDMDVHYDESRTYPGSRKGPLPSDDPEHFKEWYLNNMPRALKLIYSRLNDIKDKTKKDLQERYKVSRTNTTFHEYKTDIKEVAESALLKHQYVTVDLESDILRDSGNFVMEDETDKRFRHSDLPTDPENSPVDWNTRIWFWENWMGLYHFMNVKGFLRKIAKTNPNLPGNNYTQYFANFPHEDFHDDNALRCKPGLVPNSKFGDYYYPSLWGYYNLMPKELRNHPMMMAALQGLEKHQYNVIINKFRLI
jgi:hypothetical protein